MAPPVRRVDITNGDSKTDPRPLGMPTVTDRAAQEVVKRYLEPVLEPIFHRDSYGYRPGRSAIGMPFGRLVSDAGDMIGRSTST
jgi:RNA-directed DNA polymerase